jgi:uncharacterized protein (DUF885 family)
LADLVVRYEADRALLLRKYPVEWSLDRDERLRKFYTEEQEALRKVDRATLGTEGKVDYALMANRLADELRDLETAARVRQEVAPLVPYAPRLSELEASRRRMEALDPEKLAKTLDTLADEVRKATAAVAEAQAPDTRARSVANRAVQALERLRSQFEDWRKFYAGYDPMFTWWCGAPATALAEALQAHQDAVRDKLAGVGKDDKTTIIGFPIGRQALLDDLRAEMVPYSPEELLATADREMAWCEAELAKAARDMGLATGRDAVERVKQAFVPPGEQPALVKRLADEAVEFLEERDLVTIPPLCKEGWRMEMMTPEQQLQSPFFLGGEAIIVSYPTDGMSHGAKMMSLRGNNPYFSRATVQHELIPGHHLQGYMLKRHRSYREAFGTPFWIEGWALYWEMLLWDLGFPRTPEERVGMLFWRMHRCARIQFSLRFHLGEMTPEQCVDLLVEKVGHERENALAEVRRSFFGSYPPLYQAAYMLGGLQFMALKREMVDSNKMTLKQFHDAVLQGGQMPVAMVRARLRGEGFDDAAEWRF